MIKLEDAEIQRVEEVRIRVALAHLGAASIDLAAANGDWLSPDFLDTENGLFQLVFQTWILRVEGMVVVIDPCNGNGRDRPDFPPFHQLQTPFLERFAATGVGFEQVDLVFCTHLSCDHCGWNTQLRNGRWVPTFPNARYLFVRREMGRWADTPDRNAEADPTRLVFEDSVRPVIEAGLADLVDDRHRISAGLSIEPAHGHSIGHSVLRVRAGGDEVVFTGDVFHHPLQVLDTTLHLGDYDPAAAIEAREQLRRSLAQHEALMIPGHFPEPFVGRVSDTSDGYVFTPGV
jgi:glyoxylase-like metal-dependent hydrolase (beta-lactamase superfamily II)